MCRFPTVHNIPTSCYCSITFPNPSHPLPLSAFPRPDFALLFSPSNSIWTSNLHVSYRFIWSGLSRRWHSFYCSCFSMLPTNSYFGMSSSRGQRTLVTFPHRFTSTWNGSKAKRSSTEAFVAFSCSEVKKLDLDFLPLEGERINNKCWGPFHAIRLG